MHERELDPAVVEGLRNRGHNVEEIASGGREQAIAVDAGGKFIGVADPRGEGTAAGL
jgi:gamma-glutamyltranspeptidase/glutathione hydrolase